MLAPRPLTVDRLRRSALSPRRLAAGLGWLGAIVVVGFWGCHGPDTFLRQPDIIDSGFGGATGLGGAIGIGGHFGAGGFMGSGGVTGAGGLIGNPIGGSTGSGGAGTGGAGTGGRGIGGVTGSGGARDGGADLPGMGGMIGTGGAPGNDAGSDADGSVIGGTGPCAGRCAPPVAAVKGTTVALGTGATCHEMPQPILGGNCGNFLAPRTFMINGVTIAICVGNGGNWPTIPAPINGGYCFQSTAGQPSFAYFGAF